MMGLEYGFLHNVSSMIGILDSLLMLLVGCVLLFAAFRLRVLADEAEGGRLRLAWMGTATLGVAVLLGPLLDLFVRLVNFVLVRTGFWEVMDVLWLLVALIGVCLTLLALVGAGMLAAGLSRSRA